MSDASGSRRHAETCGTCAEREPASSMIRRCIGACYYCPVHCVYVRADESRCSHYARQPAEMAEP